MTSCPSLPSSEHAAELWEKKDPLVLGYIAGDVLLRGCLIGLGMLLAGERSGLRLAQNALGGSLVIEAFVLTWTGIKRST